MLNYSDEDSDDFIKSRKHEKNINKFMQKLNDVQILASTSESESPWRDAYKTVFGVDKPELDPNTIEGMRAINMAKTEIGMKTND